MFGAGGTAVEVVADMAVALPPLNRVLARDLISRTRVSRLLAGWRDHPPAAMDAVCDVLVAIAQMQADLPELRELDINPLLADETGVVALDARVRLDASAQSARGPDRFAIRPYPARLADTIEWEGRRVEIRPVKPEDLSLHEELFEQVAPADLRLRFFSSRRELPRSEVARFVQIDYAREMAFVAIDHPAGGIRQMLGLVQAACDPDNIEAEVAILVRSDLKGRGLGRLLMDRMIAYLRDHGTQRLAAHVLQENEVMRALVHDCGFAVAPSGHDLHAIRYLLDLQAGSPAPAPSTTELALAK
jgi:acetyltransferase